MECVVDPQGIARVPNLQTVPDFNLYECAAAAENFSVRLPGVERGQKTGRAELEKLISALGGTAAAVTDHDD